MKLKLAIKNISKDIVTPAREISISDFGIILDASLLYILSARFTFKDHNITSVTNLWGFIFMYIYHKGFNNVSTLSSLYYSLIVIFVLASSE